MRAKYVRISTANQNYERQIQNISEFDKKYIDICSGAIPFAERPEAMRLLKNKNITSVSVGEVTRLGRNMSDILKTIEDFTNKGVNLFIENLGLSTLVGGKPNQTASLIINLLGSISQYERELLNERTQQGRELAKAKGKYKGRKRGAVEDLNKYKSKHFKSIEAVNSMLNKGYTKTQISRELGISRKLIYSFIDKGLVNN
jgi:DNA invertase Pin-like site-specific DNA recombinase